MTYKDLLRRGYPRKLVNISDGRIFTLYQETSTHAQYIDKNTFILSADIRQVDKYDLMTETLEQYNFRLPTEMDKILYD